MSPLWETGQSIEEISILFFNHSDYNYLNEKMYVAHKQERGFVFQVFPQNVASTELMILLGSKNEVVSN